MEVKKMVEKMVENDEPEKMLQNEKVEQMVENDEAEKMLQKEKVEQMVENDEAEKMLQKEKVEQMVVKMVQKMVEKMVEKMKVDVVDESRWRRRLLREASKPADRWIWAGVDGLETEWLPAN